MTRRTISLLLVALMSATACESIQEPPELPSAGNAAAEFLHAWEEHDHVSMATMLTVPIPEERIGRLIDRAIESGMVTDLHVELAGEVEEVSREDFDEDGSGTTTAPFTITYTSDATTRDVSFDGELDLTLDPGGEEDGDESWTVDWTRSDLWPGVDGARAFAVTYKWLKRGAILDRDGRKLAVGHAESRRYPQGTLAGTTVGHIEPLEEEEPERRPRGRGRGKDRDDDPEPEVTDDASPSPSPSGSSPSPGSTEDEDDTDQEEDDEEAVEDEGDNESEDDSEDIVGAPGDLVGASGLELGLQEQLAGRPESKLAVVDRKGRELQVVGRSKGRPGRDVKTTLDVDVQRAAESAYGGTTGGAVVMDPATGDLLAVVASSPFGPQNYVGVPGIDPFNRALSGLYPPGSSLKVMTGAAALEEGVVKEDSTLSGPSEYKGVRNFESGAFGTLDFATAVRNSVNTAFAQIAEDLGARRLKRYADAFGFNRPHEMPLGAGTSSFPFPEDEGDVMWSSIGQAQVLATPLQMATVAATIANGGRRMEPRILMRGPKSGERVVSRKTATIMTRLMEGVVKNGTGTGAAIAGAQVAGKTGTAEVDVAGKRMNHAWFISFAPSQSPKVAVAVVSELGGIGGQVAAPLAGRILSSALPLIP